MSAFGNNEEFLKTILAVPDRLIDLGISKIGDLDLKDFKVRLQNTKVVEWVQVYDEKLRSAGKGPSGAIGEFAECQVAENSFLTSNEAARVNIYEKKFTENIRRPTLLGLEDRTDIFAELKQYVFLKSDVKMKRSILLAALGLHEGLCAIYGKSVDDRYQISASLIFLASQIKIYQVLFLDSNDSWGFQAPFRNLKPREFAKPVKPKASHRMPAGDGGTTTSGGGGGDPWGVLIKAEVFRNIFVISRMCNKGQFDDAKMCADLIGHEPEIWKGVRNLIVNVNTLKFDSGLNDGTPVDSSANSQIQVRPYYESWWHQMFSMGRPTVELTIFSQGLQSLQEDYFFFTVIVRELLAHF
jgi:hypothetical protein